MGKYKKNKPKREKKPQQHRTKEERQHEVKVILQKLNDLQLSPLYSPIQQLYIKCKGLGRESPYSFYNKK